MDIYILSLSPIKQRSPVCPGSMCPSTRSPHPITQPPSAPWPEVLAPSVDPLPLNDTPPPLPAKKHRRQPQQEQQVISNWSSESGSLFFNFSKEIFLKDKMHPPLQIFLLKNT